RLDRLGAAIPRRVVAPDHGRGRGERMAAVELERLLRRILDLLARHGLEGAGRERRGELAEMRAALHGAEELPDLLVIARPDREPHELAVGRRDPAAVVRIRHGVHPRLGIHDHEVAVDGEAQPHGVDRLAGLAHAGGEVEVVGLAVDQAALDVVEAIRALVAVDLDRARMQRYALDRRLRRAHRPMPRTPRCAVPRGSPLRAPRRSGSAARSPWRAPCRSPPRSRAAATRSTNGSDRADCWRWRT